MLPWQLFKMANELEEVSLHLGLHTQPLFTASSLVEYPSNH